MGEYYLMHSGRSKRDGAKIGSGRYPLGSGERPFQGEAGKAKRKGRLFGSKKQKKASEPEEPKKPLSDEDKQKIIESGDVRKAYANREFLTNSDIDAVITRYTKEKNLSDLIPKVDKGKKYLDKLKKSQDFLETGSKLINSGVNVWNSIARVNNAFNPDSYMTIVPSLETLRNEHKGKKTNQTSTTS